MAEEERTMYFDMEPDQIARKFWAADYLVDLVSMVGLGLIIIAGAWMANKGQWWALIIATVIAFVVFAVLNTRRLRNFAELQGILMIDCDAEKMVAVCERSAKRTKGGSERVRFRTLHGMSLALSGHPDEALEMVEFTPRDKLQVADTLNVLSVRAAAYRMKGDIAASEALTADVQAIADRLPEGNPLKNAAAYLTAQLDFVCAIAKGDTENAQAALAHLEGQAAAPERLVEAAYGHALLSELEGDEDDARTHFERVAAEGGTLAIRDKARTWLNEHPGTRNLEGQPA